MKKVALAISVFALSFEVSLAADMAVKAPVYKVPAVVAWSWTGFYLGANIGGAWTDDESFTGADPLNSFGITGLIPPRTVGRGSGVAGGIHGGYNWQVAPRFLLGVEADISGADVRISNSPAAGRQYIH